LLSQAIGEGGSGRVFESSVFNTTLLPRSPKLQTILSAAYFQQGTDGFEMLSSKVRRPALGGGHPLKAK
jgi:hypothetical protein